MNLQEYFKKVLESEKNDWTVIGCWGAGSGPSYFNQFTVWHTGKDEFQNIEVDSHGNVASLKSDLSISIAWGLSHNDDFVEEWANKFADPKAMSSFIDFFYNGNLIYRDIFVAVDGGRCRLPLPDMQVNSKTHKVESLTVPENKYKLLKLIQSLTSGHDYVRYFNEAGIEIIKEGWPK